MTFRDIERSFFDLYWHMDPVAATQAGVPGHDDRYGRFGAQALAPQLSALKSIASALEEVTVDAVRVAHHVERPTAQVRQGAAGDVEVVLDEVALGQPGLREEELVRVRDRDLVSAYPHG